MESPVAAVIVFPALLAGALLIVWAGDAGAGRGEAVHTAYHLAAAAAAGLPPNLEKDEHAERLIRMRPAGRTAGLRSLAGGCRLQQTPDGRINRGALLVGIADQRGNLWSKFVRRGGEILAIPDPDLTWTDITDFDWDATVVGAWADVRCQATAGPFASEISGWAMAPVSNVPQTTEEVAAGGAGAGEGDGTGEVGGHGSELTAAATDAGVYVSWPAPDDADRNAAADGNGGYGDGEGNRVRHQAQKCLTSPSGDRCGPWRTVQPTRAPGRLRVLFGDLPGGRYVFGVRVGNPAGWGTERRTPETGIPGSAAVITGRPATGPVITAPGMPDGPLWVAYALYKRTPGGAFVRTEYHGGTLVHAGPVNLPVSLPQVTGDCAAPGQVCYLEALVDQDPSGGYYYANAASLERTRKYFTAAGPFTDRSPA